MLLGVGLAADTALSGLPGDRSGRQQNKAAMNLKIHELKIEPMTAEAFKPFGELFDATERPADHRTIVPDKGFEIKGQTVVSVIWQPYQGLTFTQLERHFDITQSFVPMSGSLSAVAVAAPTDNSNPEDVPRPDQVRAFLIDGTVGFRYKIGTWHSLNRYILHPPGATFLMINVSPNPSEVVDYDKKFGVMFKVVL
jgi:ureidoglycolate lyase